MLQGNFKVSEKSQWEIQASLFKRTEVDQSAVQHSHNKEVIHIVHKGDNPRNTNDVSKSKVSEPGLQASYSQT